MLDLSLIGLATAFIAGTASFLSPCVLPLVPGYLSYIAGGSGASADDGL
ncbi:cytochrome c biogenesis protein CcdA, partial [Salmonella sp. 17E624]